MTDVFNRRNVKALRRRLRNNMPDAEVLLWSTIKSRQLLGYKFRRQYSVGKYVLDFYCPMLKLGIEIDGDSHFRDGVKEKDKQRQSFIESFGIRVERYLNSDVYENLEGVLEHLAGVIQERESEVRSDPP